MLLSSGSHSDNVTYCRSQTGVDEGVETWLRLNVMDRSLPRYELRTVVPSRSGFETRVSHDANFLGLANIMSANLMRSNHKHSDDMHVPRA